jgi:predicted RNase H-like HicB family nuclease
MKFYYPVIVTRKPDGTFHADFPDLACCDADGDTMDDVLGEATYAAYDWIAAELQETEPDLPCATDPVDLDLEENQEARMILVNMRLTPGFEE